jgi:DinB superfamily
MSSTTVIEAKTKTAEPARASSVKDRALEMLEWSRARTHDLLKDFPADKACHLPSPSDNHIMWVLGHIALTDEWMNGMLDPAFKSALPESYNQLFGYKTKCNSVAKNYPSLDEVKTHFDNARTALLKAARAADEETLNAPLGEKGGGFATDCIDALIKAAWHEGWHGGQIAGVRKALGLKPVF